MPRFTYTIERADGDAREIDTDDAAYALAATQAETAEATFLVARHLKRLADLLQASVTDDTATGPKPEEVLPILDSRADRLITRLDAAHSLNYTEVNELRSYVALLRAAYGEAVARIHDIQAKE